MFRHRPKIVTDEDSSLCCCYRHAAADNRVAETGVRQEADHGLPRVQMVSRAVELGFQIRWRRMRPAKRILRAVTSREILLDLQPVPFGVTACSVSSLAIRCKSPPMEAAPMQASLFPAALPLPLHLSPPLLRAQSSLFGGLRRPCRAPLARRLERRLDEIEESGARRCAVLRLGAMFARIDDKHAVVRHPPARQDREARLRLCWKVGSGYVESELDRRGHFVDVLTAGP